MTRWRGVTGYTGPVNPLASRLSSSSRPTLPGLSLAPTSAIDRGRGNGPIATRAAARWSASTVSR